MRGKRIKSNKNEIFVLESVPMRYSKFGEIEPPVGPKTDFKPKKTFGPGTLSGVAAAAEFNKEIGRGG